MTRSTFSILMACGCHVPAAVFDVCPDSSQHPANGHSDPLGSAVDALNPSQTAPYPVFRTLRQARNCRSKRRTSLSDTASFK
jgi:hypothetical protein